MVYAWGLGKRWVQKGQALVFCQQDLGPIATAEVVCTQIDPHAAMQVKKLAAMQTAVKLALLQYICTYNVPDTDTTWIKNVGAK